MPYVDRDVQDRIVGIYAVAQREGQEYVEQQDVQLEVPFNQLAALVRLRDVRKPILDALTGMLSRSLAKGEAATAASLVTASEGLLALPQYTPLLGATSDAEFDYIAHERYKAIATALPSAARSAFRDALL